MASQPDEFGDITIGNGLEPLAIASVCNGEMRRMGGKLDEHFANAELIAAAPELLQAVKDLVEALAEEEPHRWSTKPTFEKARSAIAKASGEG